MHTAICRSGFDRTQILAIPKSRRRLPEFQGFRRLRDFFARSETNTKTYARVAEYADLRTEARVFLQHQPQLASLAPCKATLVPGDKELLDPGVIARVVEPFENYRFSLVEVATDFSRHSVIDAAFVRRHAVFGKSRPVRSRSNFESMCYGSRKSGIYVRCYPKEELKSFRVELELRSSWLRHSNVQHISDLSKLPDLICPSHLRFVRIDVERLRRHLMRRGSDADRIVRRLGAHSYSIHESLQFLRTRAQVNNVHRFLVTMAPTELVLRSLKISARQFRHF